MGQVYENLSKLIVIMLGIILSIFFSRSQWTSCFFNFTCQHEIPTSPTIIFFLRDNRILYLTYQISVPYIRIRRVNQLKLLISMSLWSKLCTKYMSCCVSCILHSQAITHKLKSMTAKCWINVEYGINLISYKQILTNAMLIS